MVETFEKLQVWQKAHALMLFVHREIVPALPREERWDLASQIRRSSKSVPANVAEGHGRYYYRDQVRFLYMARGSLSETENHLVAARDLQYISDAQFAQGRSLSCDVHRLLNGYVEYLKRQRPGASDPIHDVLLDDPRRSGAV
jgi:four helix bundle protein